MPEFRLPTQLAAAPHRISQGLLLTVAGAGCVVDPSDEVDHGGQASADSRSASKMSTAASSFLSPSNPCPSGEEERTHQERKHPPTQPQSGRTGGMITDVLSALGALVGALGL